MPWTAPVKEKKKTINPIWGGIGFILIPVYGLGSYFLAQMLVRENRIQHWVYIPAVFTSLQQTIVLAIMIALLVFTLTTILWSILRTSSLFGPTDVRHSKYRRLKRRY